MTEEKGWRHHCPHFSAHLNHFTTVDLHAIDIRSFVVVHSGNFAICTWTFSWSTMFTGLINQSIGSIFHGNMKPLTKLPFSWLCCALRRSLCLCLHFLGWSDLCFWMLRRSRRLNFPWWSLFHRLLLIINLLLFCVLLDLLLGCSDLCFWMLRRRQNFLWWSLFHRLQLFLFIIVCVLVGCSGCSFRFCSFLLCSFRFWIIDRSWRTFLGCLAFLLLSPW